MTFSVPADCVFCDAADVNDNSITKLHETSEALRDPLTEIASARGQLLQASYLYNSLDPLEAWQIRVLELRPSPQQTPLVCRLFNADMLFDGGIVESGTRNRHTYVALSYSWGVDQKPRYHLDCNGIEYPIARTAYRALHRLRDESVPIFLWMDPICINQHDELEKAKQVAKMRSIYQNARKVVVYLGEHSKPEEFLVGKLTSATKWLVGLLKDFRPTGNSVEGIFFTTTDRIRRGATSGATVCAGHASLLEGGVREMSRLDWLDRIWIKQEVWAARSVQVRYGKSVMPWQTLISIRDLFELLVPLLTPDQRRVIESSCILMASKVDCLLIGSRAAHASADMDDKPNPQLLNEVNLQQDIVNVIRRSQGAKCSKLHDRIYGLLGMTSVNVEQFDEQRLNCFNVSYDEPPRETFSRLAKYIICRDQSLNVLFLDKALPKLRHFVQAEGDWLPSWVPDWRHAIGSVQKHIYCPSNRRQRRWHLPIQDSFTRLSLDAHFLGFVASRIRTNTSSVPEIHWNHRTLKSCNGERALIPPSTRRFDSLVLFEGAEAPTLIRPTGKPSTYSYVGPVFAMRTKSPDQEDLKTHFVAVISFMNLVSEDDHLTKPERIELA